MLPSEDWLLLTEMGWWVLVWCLCASWNQNPPMATGSLTARMHRNLQSELHTHLQVRLLPDGLRFCETFCNPHFVITKKEDVQGQKECYWAAGESHLGWKMNQRLTRCSALLYQWPQKWRGSHCQRLSIIKVNFLKFWNNFPTLPTMTL